MDAKDTKEVKESIKGSRATVVEIIGKTGSRGGITQVKVQLVDDQKRTLIRNVMGPVRKGDTLELMECEREARRLR